MTEPNFPKFDIDKYDDDDKLTYMKYITDLHDIKHAAVKTAIKDKYTQYYKKLIDEEQYEHFPSYAEQELRTLHKMKVKADTITDIKQGNNSHCFFTVNFKPEFNTKIDEIDKELKDFTNKCKYLGEKYAYTIEQRSEDIDNVNGLHCHILFEKGDNAPSKLQRAFKNKFFDKYVGSPACLDYRYITSDKFEQKLEYILGVKKKDKMGKVFVDREFRVKNGVKHYYEKGLKDDIDNCVKKNEIVFSS